MTSFDYSKPPHGFDVADLPASLRKTIETAGVWGPNALDAAWSHCKAHNDPPHLHPNDGSERMAAAFFSPVAEWRAAAWAWHDRRRALAVDISEQIGADRFAAPVLLDEMIKWTDAECDEVERYAALPFPRDIDMPAPLQRVLLAEGDRTC